MSKPPFVLPAGVMQIPPHYAYEQVGLRGFPLRASKAALNTLVESCLNDNLKGTGYSYKPLPTLTKYAPVYLMVSTYGRMASKLPPFSGFGWMAQTEVLFTIPLVGYQNGKPVRFALFTPYCYVDNSWSIITGNLLMGFQKGLASFQLPSDLSNPYPTEIQTTVFPVFSSDTPLSEETWIRIEQKGLGRNPGPGSLWPIGPVKDLFGRPDSAFRVDQDVLDILLGTVRSGLVDAVQLLQLRDPVFPQLAAYSKVVRFSIRLRDVHDGGLLAPAQIDIRSFDSLKVPETLGLVPDQGLFLSVLPYWVSSDFDFDFDSELEGLSGPAAPPPDPERSS